MNKTISKEEIASQNFKNGYNCAQAVLLAFHDEIGLDENTVLKLASSFGGGMGRLREVCGAVSAMFIIAGLLKGYTSNSDDILKHRHYQLIQDLAGKFKSEFGSVICRDLLGDDIADTSSKPQKRTQEYYQARPCEKFIKSAANIVEEILL